MSTSQKHQGFSVVPWYNRSEWVEVYSLVSQIKINFEKEICLEAYNKLLLWKRRMNLLPSGIEGTICLLEALNTNLQAVTDQQVILIYSSAVMRFLNVCVTGRAHGKNFTRTVRHTTIPDWIISLRHDFSHSYKLPSYEILKLAVEYCFEWVVETYWQRELGEVKDFIIPCRSADELSHLFECYAQAITDVLENGETLQEKTKEKVASILPYSEANGLDLYNELSTVIKDIEFIPDECKSEIVNCFVNANVFYYGNSSENGKGANHPKVSIQQWKLIQGLVNVFNHQNLLIKLIIAFSDILNDCEELDGHKVCIAFWLEEIFKGIAMQTHKGIKISRGFTFEEKISDRVYLELEGLFTRIFLTFDASLLAAFKCFFLIWRGQFDDYVTQYYKNMIKIINGLCDEPEDEIDVSFNGFNEEINVEKEPVKRRWVLEPKDVGYEHCALGVLPYS